MAEAYLTGIFPRSEDLIAATRGFDRGRVTKEEVDDVLRRDVEELIRLQKEAGFDVLCDGLLNWQDLFRPLVEAWNGLTLGGLKRWYDNNTFFRQPIITSSLEPGPLPEDCILIDALPEDSSGKAVLPGPYTFGHLAEDRYYSDPGEAVTSLANCLSQVVSDLGASGIVHIQFSEPSLVVNPPSKDLMEAVRDAYALLTRVNGYQTSLHLYFAPAQPLLRDLIDLPVDVIGLDLYEEDPRVLEDVDFDKVLACGCVDSRNSLLETPEEIAGLASSVREALSPRGLILCPNADLEFLPRVVAEEKVWALGKACQLLEETG